LAALVSVAAAPAPSVAVPVEEVVSPGGVRAWLVRAPASPLIALHFAFMGGSVQDPDGKEGVAAMLASLLGEGAGGLDGPAFRSAVARAGLRIDFSAARDAIFGSAEFVGSARDEALELLRLALVEARLDASSIETVRSRMLAENAAADRDQRAIAYRHWHERAFAGHRYARPAEGTETSLAQIGREDLVRFRNRLLSRGALRVAVVADLEPSALGALLDRVFASLPAEIAMVPPRTIPPRLDTGTAFVDSDFPRALAITGLPFLAPHDPDFAAALVLQRILAGDQLEARLLAEIRVRRGIAYSASLEPAGDSYTTFLRGELFAPPDRMTEALAAVKAVIAEMAAAGPTEAEVEAARSYLIGSFPLGFDSSSRIAANLLSLRMAGHDPGYLARRPQALAAVSRADVQRVAGRLLAPNTVAITVVGPRRPAR
jgi:zinc protease